MGVGVVLRREVEDFAGTNADDTHPAEHEWDF